MTVHNQVHDTLEQINIKWSAISIEKAWQFNVDDWVLVDRRNLQIKAGNNRSLTNKWIGPCKVTKAIATHAYQLEVPQGTQWHNIIHTTLFKPFRRRDEPQDMVEDEEDVHKVESIIDSSKNRGGVKYRVR